MDYVSFCDPATLEEVQTVNSPELVALAVKLGAARLIDNTLLEPDKQNTIPIPLEKRSI